MNTKTLSLYDPFIAPLPEWEYYSREELSTHSANGYVWAVVTTSWDQFPKAHCVLLREYNAYIDTLVEEMA